MDEQLPVILVYGDPASGFKFIGPVIPNDPDLDEYIDTHLPNETWWYVPVTTLDQARAEV